MTFIPTHPEVEPKSPQEPLLGHGGWTLPVDASMPSGAIKHPLLASAS